MRFGPKFFISQQQKDFYYCNAPYPAFVTGYGGGKTWAGSWKALRLSLWNAGLPGLIVEPTFRDFKEILFPVLVDDILARLDGCEHCYPVESKGSYLLKLPWGSTLIFRSGNPPEGIRGITAAWAYMDEAGLMSPRVFQNLSARLRHPETKLFQIFTTFTPEMGGWTHDKWGKTELFGLPLDPGYVVYQGGTKQNWVIDEERKKRGEPTFYEMQLEQWGPVEAESRLNGKFGGSKEGRVYYPFEYQRHVDRAIAYNPDCALWLTFDFNSTPGVHSLAYQKQAWRHVFIDEAHHVGGKPGFVDNLKIEGACRYWVEKYAEKHTGKVYITGDPSGQYSSSRNDYYKLIMDHTAGFKGQRILEVPPTAPEVTERINNFNRLLLNGKGYSYIFIHPDCARLMADLQSLVSEAYKAQMLGRPYKGETPNHPDKSDNRLTHACFVAGTLVITATGERPIESIKAGDIVLTRMGWKHVEESWSAGIRDCGRVKLDNGRALVGTDYHMVYTNNGGFIPLDTVGYGDILESANYWQEVYPCEQKSSYSMGSDFIDALIRAIGAPGFTLAHLRPGEREALDGFIRKYGRLIMGLSGQGIISTIETAILLITRSETLNASAEQIISNCMGPTYRKHERNNCAGYFVPQGKRPQSGIQAPKGAHGISSTAKNRGSIESQVSMYAPYAQGGSVADTPERCCIAEETASRQPGDAREKIMSIGRAPIAEMRFRPTNIKSNYSATNHVERPYESVGRMEVFNLRVNDAHEYFASGVLVANSDAAGYLIWNVDPLKTRFDRVVDYRRA